MADRQSIGLTPSSQGILDELMRLGWFAEGQDLARFAMAYAIEHGVTPGATENTETRWAIGNFDDNREIRDVIGAVYPTVSEPVRCIEHFVNEGLRLIGDQVAAGRNNVTDYFVRRG